MRYNHIRDFDISNGLKIGVSLFVQGCPFHCYNCFNKETWDFNGGNEWTQKVEDEFFRFISSPNIGRVSFLGGEPLADQNVETVLYLIREIKTRFPNKRIWLWTGFTYESIIEATKRENDEFANLRLETINECDFIVDGQFIYALRDLSLKFKGSSNQRVINIKETQKQGKIILL